MIMWASYADWFSRPTRQTALFPLFERVTLKSLSNNLSREKSSPMKDTTGSSSVIFDKSPSTPSFFRAKPTISLAFSISEKKSFEALSLPFSITPPFLRQSEVGDDIFPYMTFLSI